MKFAWATRGRHWGFRFLYGGGLTDPRREYLRLFANSDGQPTLVRRSDGYLAARFPDPDGRTDAAGRIIPHEFIVLPPAPSSIVTVEDAIAILWPLVLDKYAEVWDAPNPPARRA